MHGKKVCTENWTSCKQSHRNLWQTPILNAWTTLQRDPHSNTEIPLSVLLLLKIIGYCIDSLVHKLRGSDVI